MEFAVCKAGVKSIKILKDQAKFLSRSKGIALHKCLDSIAIQEGYENGWHDLALSKWSLGSDMSLSKTDVERQVSVQIVFPMLDSPDDLVGATGVAAYISREMAGRKPVDIVHLEAVHEGEGLADDPDSRQLLDKIALEPKLGLGCILAIHISEKALTGDWASVNVLTSMHRKMFEIRRMNGMSSTRVIHEGVFETWSTPVAYMVFPSDKQAHVSLIYALADDYGLIDIPRDQWIALMEETIRADGDPRDKPEACMSMIFRIHTEYYPDRKDGSDLRKNNDQEGLENP